MVRAYQAFNYTSFDLNELSKKNEIHLALLSSLLKPLGGDGTTTRCSRCRPRADPSADSENPCVTEHDAGFSLWLSRYVAEPP